LTQSTRPGHRALRRGRRSLPRQAYFVTTCLAEGQTYLSERACAEVVIEALQWLHNTGRIELHGYVVMPDHVHVLFTLCEDNELSQVIQIFKGYSARRINSLLGRTGSLWQSQFYDHAIRDKADLVARLEYMLDNPRRQGLVQRYEDWPSSSAHPTRAGTVAPW